MSKVDIYWQRDEVIAIDVLDRHNDESAYNGSEMAVVYQDGSRLILHCDVRPPPESTGIEEDVKLAWLSSAGLVYMRLRQRLGYGADPLIMMGLQLFDIEDFVDPYDPFGG